MLPNHPRLRLAVVHGGLFLATCLTTTFGSYALVAGGPLRAGLPFAATLMSILLAHEMGHFVVARRRNVPVSLPYFIPVPLVGTFGAVIRMPPVRSRDSLVAIGAAGPLAGLMVAIPCLMWGLHLSPVTPITPGGEVEGNSLLYLGLKYIMKGAVLPGGGKDVLLHPVAFAGWMGLMLTQVNLMPIGQLDGGHIAFGYFGDRYERASAVWHRALIVVGLIVAMAVGAGLWRRVGVENATGAGLRAAFPWFVWAVVIEVLRRLTGGRYHPDVGVQPLSTHGRFVAHLVVAVFVLIFVPIPFRAAVP